MPVDGRRLARGSSRRTCIFGPRGSASAVCLRWRLEEAGHATSDLVRASHRDGVTLALLANAGDSGLSKFWPDGSRLLLDEFERAWDIGPGALDVRLGDAFTAASASSCDTSAAASTGSRRPRWLHLRHTSGSRGCWFEGRDYVGRRSPAGARPWGHCRRAPHVHARSLSNSERPGPSMENLCTLGVLPRTIGPKRLDGAGPDRARFELLPGGYARPSREPGDAETASLPRIRGGHGQRRVRHGCSGFDARRRSVCERPAPVRGLRPATPSAVLIADAARRNRESGTLSRWVWSTDGAPHGRCWHGRCAPAPAGKKPTQARSTQTPPRRPLRRPLGSTLRPQPTNRHPPRMIRRRPTRHGAPARCAPQRTTGCSSRWRFNARCTNSLRTRCRS